MILIGVAAQPLPTAVRGFVYQPDNVTQVSACTLYSVNDTTSGSYIEAETGFGDDTGKYAATIDGETGDVIIVHAYNLTHQGYESAVLNGVTDIDVIINQENVLMPLIKSIPNTTVDVNSNYSYLIEVGVSFNSYSSEWVYPDHVTHMLIGPPGMTITEFSDNWGFFLNGCSQTNALIEWTPTTAGLFDISIKVIDSVGTVNHQNFTLEVIGDAPIIDCNNNSIDDSIDIQNHNSFDCNLDGIPDECAQLEQTKQKKNKMRFKVKTDHSYRQKITLEKKNTWKRSRRSLKVRQESVTATMKVLATEITFGANGPDVPVRLNYSIQNNEFQSGFNGEDLEDFDTDSIDLTLGEIVFKGMSAYPNFTDPSRHYLEALSTGMNVISFQNGDNLDNITTYRGVMSPLGNQTDISCAIAPYVDLNTHEVQLPNGEMLMLFELGTTNQNSAAYDFQDLVLVVTP